MKSQRMIGGINKTKSRGQGEGTVFIRELIVAEEEQRLEKMQ